MRRIAVVVVCALGLFTTACGRSGGGRSMLTRAGSSQGADRLATSAAYAFLSSYTTDGGRIQRSDQGGDTVGEGQAYGMLAAVAVGDQKRFDRIWSWTKQNMSQSNGLLVFHWAGGRVVDPHPAADADLDAARALLVASCRFQRPDLREAAIRIGRAVLAAETARAGSLLVLLAGSWGKRGASIVFNPSYVDPTTLDALASATGDSRFRALAADSTELVDQLMRPLPPDWATVNTATGQAMPVSGPNATSGPGMFTYDAPRTLVRMGVDPDLRGRAAATRASTVFSKTAPQDIVAEHQLSGAPAGGTHSPITLVAAAGGAKAAGDTGAVSKLLAVAQDLNAQRPTYYGSAWVALGRLLLTTNRLTPCG